MPKLLFFSGSTRQDSLNQKLLNLAVTIAQDLGAEVTPINLKDFSMPIFNGDDEVAYGLPENAKKLKVIFAKHDGLFIASPEHNRSIPALLKNTLDWISRTEAKDEKPLAAFKDKVVALGSVSPGMLGGLHGLIQLRMMLTYIGVNVIPAQTTIISGLQAFDSNGMLKNARQLETLKRTVTDLVITTSKLAC